MDLSTIKSVIPSNGNIFLFIIPIFFFYLYQLKETNSDPNSSSHSNIPWAPGATPILGHALEYRENPAAFLIKLCTEFSTNFRLNLAGRHMTLICGPRDQRKIATAPESIMSARKAVAELGFEQTLGKLNVDGLSIDFLKGNIKSAWHRDPLGQVEGWKKSLEKALEEETLGSNGKEIDFFHLIRRVMLHAVIEHMVSPIMLDKSKWDNDFDFLSEYMAFQDSIEDVTAKAGVVHRWLALPLFLWPVQRRRIALQKKIANHLRLHILSDSAQQTGFWLSEMTKSKHSVEEVAEYVIALLFAAHKNPSIGAAQAYLMLWENLTNKDQELCIKDAFELLQDTTNFLQPSSHEKMNHLCLEVLRMTAHSIGAVRTAEKDFILEGRSSGSPKKIIAKGTTVALAHIPSSLDPTLWKNPNTLDLNRSLELYQNEYIFTTFSHGIHKCPGSKISLFVLECIVSLLLIRYDIILPEEMPPLSFERNTLAQRAGPVMVKVFKKI